MTKYISYLTLFILFLCGFKSQNLEVKDDVRTSAGSRTITNNAYTHGEELNYRVHYGIINAAKIKLRVDANDVEVNGKKTFHLIADGKTISTFDWMFKVRDRFESYVDQTSYAPHIFFKSVKEDSYKDIDKVWFDHNNKKLLGKKKNMECPMYVQDILSGIYYARTIDFSNSAIGQKYPVDIYLDQTIYNLEFKYLGKETIKSDIGKVKCIKLRPKAVVDRVFKSEDAITIWVSEDSNKVPIRIEAQLQVGSIKCDLTDYKGLKGDFKAKVK